MKAIYAGVAFAFSGAVAGCAGPGASSPGTATLMLAGTGAVSTEAVKNAISIGKSTKADVMAALGKTTIISFDSGFEVWVYRYADGAASGRATPDKTEFVVLFAPSGIVTKTRIRPAPPPA